MPKMKDVDFIKCNDHSMGITRAFWRADYQGMTIASLCRTKAECIKEVRAWLRKHNKSEEKA